MKKRSIIILLLLIAVSFAGCCKRVLPPERNDSVTIIRDNYKEIIRDSIVYMQLPRDCVSVMSIDTSSHLIINAAISYASVRDGVLIHSLYANPSFIQSVRIVYKDKVSVRDSIVYANKVEYVHVKKPLSWFEKTFMFIGIGFFISLSVYLAVKLVLKK